jgi:hypothetical protein
MYGLSKVGGSSASYRTSTSLTLHIYGTGTYFNTDKYKELVGVVHIIRLNISSTKFEVPYRMYCRYLQYVSPSNVFPGYYNTQKVESKQ